MDSVLQRLLADRILGVDPGTNVLGYAVIDSKGGRIGLCDYGALKLSAKLTAQEKLREIYFGLQELIERWLPAVMAIETPFYGKNVQSMLKLGRAQGVAITAAITMGLEIHEYSPKKIKLAVTGNGNASKEQVHAMVERLIGKQLGRVTHDTTDAIAAALCHLFQNRRVAEGDAQHYSSWIAYVKAHPERLR